MRDFSMELEMVKFMISNIDKDIADKDRDEYKKKNIHCCFGFLKSS